jgi:phospholipid/cholesterol/gamma-HCH transport system ATP-binding protein
LYDEPTAGLDPITARTICELALKLRDLEECSSIFVTHRLQDIEVLANEYVLRDDKGNLLFEHEGDKMCLINTKFIMLKDGDVIFSGTDEEMRVSDNPYIQRFLT